MKTVLHMIETAGPGGAETVLLDLLKSLDPARWRSIAILPSRGWLHDQLGHAGIETLVIAERGNFDAMYFARILSVLRRSKVDLIHSHLFGSAVRASILSLVSGIPAVATLHGQTDISSKERFRFMKIAALNRLCRVVFVSEQLRQNFVETNNLRPQLALVIVNGIDTARFGQPSSGDLRSVFGISADEFVVGTVGNPGPAKGLDLLVEVAALLKSRASGFRFIVAGDLSDGRGADIVGLRDTRGLRDDVIFTGFRSDVEMVLGALDLFVLPSRSEGFSLALIEAMAAGLPVVATRCGGPEGIIDHGDTGLLVENGSAHAIAAAIESLRGQPEVRRRMGQAAQAVVRQRYTREAQVLAYESLYEECLAA